MVFILKSSSYLLHLTIKPCLGKELIIYLKFYWIMFVLFLQIIVRDRLITKYHVFLNVAGYRIIIVELVKLTCMLMYCNFKCRILPNRVIFNHLSQILFLL